MLTNRVVFAGSASVEREVGRQTVRGLQNGAKLSRYQHYSLSWFEPLLVNHLRIKESRLHHTNAVNLPPK